jgi:hypothetical protein
MHVHGGQILDGQLRTARDVAAGHDHRHGVLDHVDHRSRQQSTQGDQQCCQHPQQRAAAVLDLGQRDIRGRLCGVGWSSTWFSP